MALYLKRLSRLDEQLILRIARKNLLWHGGALTDTAWAGAVKEETARTPSHCPTAAQHGINMFLDEFMSEVDSGGWERRRKSGGGAGEKKR